MTPPNKAVFQPWSEEAFQADVYVRGMTAVQRWIYRTLLQAAFDHSTRPYLPNDDEILWVLAGCDSQKQWEKNKSVVLKQFTLTESNLLEHKRVTVDWNKAMDARKRMSMLAKKSHGIDDTFSAGSAHAARTHDGALAHADRTQSTGNAIKDKVSKEKESELQVTGAGAPGEEPDMARTTREIELLCHQILGIKPPQKGHESWREVEVLAKSYGVDNVIEAFKAWAEENQGDSRITYPISAFLKVSDGLLRGTIALQTPESKALIFDLAEISNGEVTFDSGQSMKLARLLKDYTADEIKIAFRTYYSRVCEDQFLLKNASRKFPEEAAQLCELTRREAAQRAKDIAGAERGHAERMKREEEFRAAKLAKEAEEPTVDEDEWETPIA